MADNNKHDDLDQRIQWLVEMIWNDQRARIPSGDFPGAEDYLKKFPELGTSREAAVDVIYNEFVVCKDCGLSVDEAEFCSRFPEFAVLIERQFYLARSITSDSHNDRTASANESTVESEAASDSRNRPVFETRSSSPGNRLPPETASRSIGRYRIGPEIGRGSFAIVHKAWDPQLNRILAIKLPRPELVESSNLKKRMLREARSAAQLYHPAIVSVHEIGEHEGAPFILTDFVDGVTMEERLSTSPPSQQEAVSWTAIVADALHYAHQNGIIHRDIKPANILIRTDGQVLLTDFGLARLADSAGSITTHGDIVGTPSYMSPEQAEGLSTVDYRTDIFSLGVVLYRCLAGELPFDGPVSSILHRVIHEPVESISSDGKFVPRDLQTIILKCLAKHPDDRYRTARELASDLNCFLAGEPISARAVGLAERMLKYARRRPRITALIVATMVLLGFVAGGAIQLANVMRQRDRAQTAELQAQALTANSNYDAGLLAKQQGNLSVAIGHFENCISRGFDDPVSACLQLAECQLASGQIDEARSQLQTAVKFDSGGHRAAEIAYWNCELELLGSEAFGSTLELLEAVPAENLSRDQQDFLQGMKAENSMEALEHFRSATENNRFHHSARRSFLILAFSLAHFEEVLRESEMSQRLYPDDDDFRLLEALAAAATGQSDRARHVIGSTQLDDQEKKEWNGFCKTIGFVTTELNNEDATGQLSPQVIFDLATQFQAQHWSLVSQRRWHFPPRIARHFADFPGFSNELVAEGSDSVSTRVIALAEAHPEASLLTLAARTCIDVEQPRVEDLEQARELFQLSLEHPAFLRDAHHHARIGIYATSAQLALVNGFQVEQNTQRLVDAAAAIEPESITRSGRLRTITLTLINANEWDLAEQWSRRWSVLATQTKAQKINALWHYGIVLEKKQRWLDLVAICDELLKLDPEMTLAQDFRARAVSELKKIVESEDTTGGE